MLTENFLAFAGGLVVGSFLNVVIYRLPRGESVVTPGSRCPSCGMRLAWYDLIPIVSYLVLGGRCRYCRRPVSLRYPVVELLTGITFTLLWQRFGAPAMFAKYAFFVAILIAAGAIDAAHYIVPDKLVFTGLAGAVIFGFLAKDTGFWCALAGAIAAGGVLLALALLSRGGMGGGDIKLAAVGGLYVGWPFSLVALFLAALCGSLVGCILLVLRKKGRKEPLQFAPYLGIGFFLAALYGNDIVSWYSNYLYK